MCGYLSSERHRGREVGRLRLVLLQILSLLVSLIVSSHYAILLSVGLIHALNTVSFHVFFIVLLSFQRSFQLFICLNI